MKTTNYTKSLLASLFLIPLVAMAQMPPPNVNVVAAEKTTLAPTVWVSGTVVSQNNSNVAADVSGRLMMLAQLGSKVQQGDIIAKIDDTTLKIEVQEDKAAVQNAKSRLAFLESEVKRLKSLNKRNLTSQTELDQTISNRDIAKGNLAAAKARLALTKQQLAYTDLKAPFSGLVVERLSNQGEYVNSGTAIVRLVETENLEASLFAPIASYNFVKAGSPIAVESALGQKEVTVKSVIPVADNRSQLMEVRLDMSSANWPVGLSIKGAIANGPSKEVVAVPRDALVLRRGGASVFIVDAENKAQMVSVQVGVAQGELVEVLGQVSVGANVIVRGAERLQPGQAVQVKDNNSALVSGGRVSN